MPKTTDRDRSYEFPLVLRAQTADEEKLTVEAVISTDAPATVWDWDRGLIDEVLVSGGFDVRGGKVPLQEDHSRTVEKMRGSVRAIRDEGGQVTATLYFAGDDVSRRRFELVRDGHLTDVSVGYSPDMRSAVWIEKGGKADVDGRTYEATAERGLRITRKWTLREVSLVPIGADAGAVMREDAGDPATEKEHIMPENIKQDEQARSAAPTVDVEQERAAATAVERARVTAIEDLSRGEFADIKDTAIREGWTLERAAKEFKAAHIAARATTPVKHDPITQSDMTDCAEPLKRGLAVALARQTCPTIEAKPDEVPVAEKFRGLRLSDMVRAICDVEGIRVEGGSNWLERAAFSSASIANVIGNVANKTLAMAYTERPPTLLQWAGRRSSNDFKLHSDIVLSVGGSMPEVPAGGELELATLLDKKETRRLKTYGRRLAIDRQTIINDDLNAFLQIPLQLGRKCAQTIDDIGYMLLTSNSGVGPTMAEDSHPLFYARSTSNYSATTTAIGTAGMNTMHALFRGIRGLGGEVLNLSPKFLIVPAALEATALTFNTSSSIMSSGTTDKLHPMNNIYYGRYTVIVEGRLDPTTNGTTAWYLATLPSDQESIVVSFLNGNDTPIIRPYEMGPETLGQGWQVYFDAGVDLVDWRGICRAKGA